MFVCKVLAVTGTDEPQSRIVAHHPSDPCGHDDRLEVARWESDDLTTAIACFYSVEAVDHGIDAAAVNEGMNRPAIKDQLRTGVEQAQARGVFGAPFMMVDGEPFWGFDRFDQMEIFLKNGRIN